MSHIIAQTEALGPADLKLADLDGDSDLDALAALSGQNAIAWYQNTNGTGTFDNKHRVTASAVAGQFVTAGDGDGDGDLDLLSAAGSILLSFGFGKIVWYENRPTGDSNDDGVFDSSDLVAVFQAREYEDAIDGNSTFD